MNTTAFLAGDITITLTNTPISSDAILLFYNGAKVRPGLGGFSVSSNIITIEFSDDPATYDNGEVLFELYSLWA